MNLRKLVGKKVIRTKPFMDKRIIINNSHSFAKEEVVEIPDYKFCDCDDGIIEVVEVVQDTIIAKVSKDGCSYFYFISGKYDDDNWKDVTEVYKRIDEIRMESFKNFKEAYASLLRSTRLEPLCCSGVGM